MVSIGLDVSVGVRGLSGNTVSSLPINGGGGGVGRGRWVDLGPK